MQLLQAITLLSVALIAPVHSLPETTHSQAGANLIVNGGFESGQLSPWVFRRLHKRNHAYYEISQPGLTKGGRYKFEYNARTVYDPEFEGPLAGFGILQNVTVVQGAMYSISFTYLNQPKPKNGGDSELYVQAGDADWRDYTAPKNKIVTFSRTFTASSSVIQVGIYFDANPYYGYDSRLRAAIDNVKILKL